MAKLFGSFRKSKGRFFQRLIALQKFSFADIPSNPDSHTLYCIQGEIIIVDSFDDLHNNTGDTDPGGDEEPEENNSNNS